MNKIEKSKIGFKKNNAYFELSKSKILSQFEKVKNHCDIVSYSSKTNPKVSGILENELDGDDCIFSVHLVNELDNVKDYSRVLFLAQAWDNDEISYLISQGVSKFAVDNLHDLGVLEKYLSENSEVQVQMLFLRLKLRERSIRTEKYFVFGMIAELISKKIKELRKNDQIDKLGIHFHRKTQNMSEWNYGFELSEMFDDEFFSCLDVVNMGGGLPAKYANTDMRLLNGIFSKIDLFREWLVERSIKLIIEPGRFIAAPAGKLITKVIAVDSKNIVVNASVYNSNMDAVIVPVKLLIEGEINSGADGAMQYCIKGVTPCSLDLFRYRVYLRRVSVGDKLIFLNAGAYNFSSNFCNLIIPDVKVVE